MQTALLIKGIGEYRKTSIMHVFHFLGPVLHDTCISFEAYVSGMVAECQTNISF